MTANKYDAIVVTRVAILSPVYTLNKQNLYETDKVDYFITASINIVE